MSLNLILKSNDRAAVSLIEAVNNVLAGKERTDRPQNLQDAVDILQDVIAEGLERPAANYIVDPSKIALQEAKSRRNHTNASAKRRKRQLARSGWALLDIVQQRLPSEHMEENPKALEIRQKVLQRIQRARAFLQQLDQMGSDDIDLAQLEDELYQSLTDAFQTLEVFARSEASPIDEDVSARLSTKKYNLTSPKIAFDNSQECEFPLDAIEQFEKITGFKMLFQSDRTAVDRKNNRDVFFASSSSGEKNVDSISQRELCDFTDRSVENFEPVSTMKDASDSLNSDLINHEDRVAELFTGQVEIKKHAPLIIHNRELQDLEITRLVGAPNGAQIEIVYSPEPPQYELFIKHDFFERPAIVQIVEPTPDKMELYWHHIVLRSSASGRNLGRRIVMESVMQAAQLQFDTVATPAIGAYGTEYQGYRVWPNLGFDRLLNRRELQALQSELTEDEKHSLNINTSMLPEELSLAQSIVDLTSSTLGRLWWKIYGSGGLLNFDLQRGSQSWQLFNRTAREAGFVHLVHMSQRCLTK